MSEFISMLILALSSGMWSLRVHATIFHPSQCHARVGAIIPQRRKLTEAFTSHLDLSCSETLPARSKELIQGNKHRYLTVTTLNEQLTKARLHLAELMYMARLTNRTLVLPKCQYGQLGNSLFVNQSLCIYFDLDKMGEYIQWMSEDAFLDVMAEYMVNNGGRKLPIYTLTFKKTEHKCTRADISQPKFTEPKSLRHNLTMAVLNRSSYICANCHRESDLPLVLSLLLDKTVNSANVLVIGKLTPFKCVNYEVALPHLAYSPKLTTIVDRFITQELGPRYLSIHWRVEAMSNLLRDASLNRIMSECARGLIRTAKNLTMQHNLTGVFIAMDISPDNMIHSTSFGLGKSKRAEVLSVVKNVYHALKPKMWGDFDGDIPKVDSGVLGILDKLTCSKGHIFLYPPNSCFGIKVNRRTPSSYTREIIGIRASHNLPKPHSLPWTLE